MRRPSNSAEQRNSGLRKDPSAEVISLMWTIPWNWRTLLIARSSLVFEVKEDMKSMMLLSRTRDGSMIGCGHCIVILF